MGVFSGKYGVVNGMNTVRNWVLNESSTPAEFRASNTQSGTGRRAGIYDFTGSFEGYGGTPPVMPSEYFDFTGYTAPATGAYNTAGLTKSASNAIVESVTINWNWQNGELLNWVANFAAGEPLIITEASGTNTDVTSPDPPIVCGTKVTLTAGNTVWPNIVSASLTITAANPTFVNSSTAGKTGRRPGIIDWEAAINEETTGMNSNLITDSCLGSAVGGNNVLRLWVDATDYWDLFLAHHVSTTDLRVDMDTGDIVSQTNNFAMAGVDDNGNIGRIGRPGEDGASNPWWWPTEVTTDTLPF